MNAKMNFKHSSTATTSSFYSSNSFLTSAINNDTERFVVINDSSAIDKIDIDEAGKYSVFDVANWFLIKSPMTHKKLQKLCYYAQAWCYALNNYRLENTDYQAWVHGPVSPALWERFKAFGYDTISIKGKVSFSFDFEDKIILEDVWDTYGEKTGNALEILSHRELPWIEARKGYEPEEKCSIVISPESMKQYYKSIYCGD